MKQVCHKKRASLHRQSLKKLHLHLFADPHIGMLHLNHIMMLTWAFCNGDTRQHTTALHIIDNLRNVFRSFFGSSAYMRHLPSIISAKSISDAPCSASLTKSCRCFATQSSSTLEVSRGSPCTPRTTIHLIYQLFHDNFIDAVSYQKHLTLKPV